MSFHPLIPTAAMAPRVLLTGDPGRALMLAQLLLDTPRMANHARGLWGYTGAGADGEPLTVQSSGIGGPSVALVLEQLAELGVGDVVRLGTARGATAAPGQLLHVARVLGVGAPSAVPHSAFAGDATVASVARQADAIDPQAVAFDLTSGPFLAVAAELGLRAGVLLAVVGPPELDEEARLVAEQRLGHAGARLLGLPDRPSVA